MHPSLLLLREPVARTHWWMHAVCRRCSAWKCRWCCAAGWMPEPAGDSGRPARGRQSRLLLQRRQGQRDPIEGCSGQDGWKYRRSRWRRYPCSRQSLRGVKQLEREQQCLAARAWRWCEPTERSRGTPATGSVAAPAPPPHSSRSPDASLASPRVATADGAKHTALALVVAKGHMIRASGPEQEREMWHCRSCNMPQMQRPHPVRCTCRGLASLAQPLPLFCSHARR